MGKRGSELKARWPDLSRSDAELAELAGRELLRQASRLGRRRVRARLAADALLREALEHLDS